MGYQRITNLQRDGLQKVIRMERDFSLYDWSLFCISKYFYSPRKTTFAYPFIQFFLGQCLRGGEMFLIFLPIFFILSPNEFQEVINS